MPVNTDVTALLIAPSTVETVDLMVFQMVDIVLLIVFMIVVMEFFTAVKSPVISPLIPLTTALMIVLMAFHIVENTVLIALSTVVC